MATLMGLFLFGHNDIAYAGTCDPGDSTSLSCPINSANPVSPAQQAIHVGNGNNDKEDNNTNELQENNAKQFNKNDSLSKIISFIKLPILFLGTLLSSYIIFKMLILRR